MQDVALGFGPNPTFLLCHSSQTWSKKEWKVESFKWGNKTEMSAFVDGHSYHNPSGAVGSSHMAVLQSHLGIIWCHQHLSSKTEMAGGSSSIEGWKCQGGQKDVLVLEPQKWNLLVASEQARRTAPLKFYLLQLWSTRCQVCHRVFFFPSYCQAYI